MNLGLVEVNTEDEILMINQSFSEMSGYTEEELLGKKGGEILQADKSSNLIKKENKKRLKGQSNSYELEAVTKAGDIRQWLISGTPNFDINGNIIGSIGIHLDITDNKRNSELIKQKKKELDVIVDNSPIGIVLTKFGEIIRANETFQNLLGYSQADINELSIADVSIKDDYAESKALLDQMNSGLIDSFTQNKRYKKKDGSVIWAKTNVNAVRNASGEIEYQVALIEDITSEREKVMIIDMINNLTKSILGKTDINEIAWEIVNNIAKYLDSDDCVIYLVNHDDKTLEQAAAYGRKLDHNKGIKKKMRIPFGVGVVGSVVESGVSEVIKDTSLDSRYIVDIVDNVKRYSEITVPIISDGKVIAIIDSEHKNKNYYTQSNVEAIEHIASLVAITLRTALNIRERRKAEMKNKSLLEQLERSNDELQEYAHVVSHDLKSPLRSINALVSWIKEDNSGEFDDNTLKNFDLIGMTLEKMEQLISDILIYSSVESKKANKTKVDLNTVVNELKRILYIPDHINLLVKTKLPSIYGEKAKFQQLFQNLISNAIKFNDKEEGMIEIDVDDKGSFYQFTVKDNGVGIAKKYHKKIFEIFHSLKKDNEDSTGIGLSIVKKIINLHEGQIWLDSSPGIGTTFYFTIKK